MLMSRVSLADVLWRHINARPYYGERNVGGIMKTEFHGCLFRNSIAVSFTDECFQEFADARDPIQDAVLIGRRCSVGFYAYLGSVLNRQSGVTIGLFQIEVRRVTT